MASNKQLITVFATGVFDVLHIEHIRFLSAAAQQGDRLIVGVESDVRVRQLKGVDRPIHSEQIRLEQVQAIRFVHQAFVLPEQFNQFDDWLALMQHINADVYAVSAHTSHRDTKQQICDQLGVMLKVVRPHNKKISTSLLLEKVEK